MYSGDNLASISIELQIVHNFVSSSLKLLLTRFFAQKETRKNTKRSSSIDDYFLLTHVAIISNQRNLILSLIKFNRKALIA